jgi:2-polyprenyl-3-methyl-5-hydroxy-6-metoxy-1,4-benzoquinol methylase
VTMELDSLKRHWEAFGRDDPLWAVLTSPERTGGRWDLDEFLATGVHEVSGVVDELLAFGVTLERGRALDFGCGVGRLTQALGDRFDRCDGVDIAGSMIDQARRVNRHGVRVNYHVHTSSDLSLFADQTFDFVLSLLVLQHMEPRYAKRYIAEFIRVLKRGGVAVFQVPTGRWRQSHFRLPQGAFRASLALVGVPLQNLTVLEQARVRVRVRNDSTHTWPGASCVRLGNHWLDRNGRTIIKNDGRADLGVELPPGGERTIDLMVRAPALAGPHILELDLIQEDVGWFADRGSRPLRLTTNVHPTSSGQPTPQNATASDAGGRLLPMMEMHGIPEGDVHAAVTEAGGEILHQLADARAGTNTEGFRYIVRRVAERTPALPPPALSYLRDAITAVPDRADMFPPLITRRSGWIGRLELRLREKVGRVIRPITWVQADYDRRVLNALNQSRAALEQQDAELRRLNEELTRLKHSQREQARLLDEYK